MNQKEQILIKLASSLSIGKQVGSFIDKSIQSGRMFGKALVDGKLDAGQKLNRVRKVWDATPISTKIGIPSIAAALYFLLKKNNKNNFN